jgi:hypothetical protein
MAACFEDLDLVAADVLGAMRGRILGFNVSAAHVVWADQQYQ